MLAIIGGTGLYALDGLSDVVETEVETPFGRPSAPIMRARYGAHELLFLPRHGRGHALLPHEVNYRANVFALKMLGARQVLGVSAVGSLRADIAPGDFVAPTQYFDWVHGARERTFFGNGMVAHVSTAEPVSGAIVRWLAGGAAALGLTLHAGVTYAAVDGPRFGTRVESRFLRQAGCDVVGMTNVPEVFLACEAQMCYATLGVVTDYDSWMDDPLQHANVAIIMERFGASLTSARRLFAHLLDGDIPAPDEACRATLAHALLTPRAAIAPPQRAVLDVLEA